MRRLLAPLTLFAAVVPLRADEPREIIERAVKAHGGADSLERWTATRISATGTLDRLNRWSEQVVVQGGDKYKSHCTIAYFDNLGVDQTQILAEGKGWLKETIQGGPIPKKVDINRACTPAELQDQAYLLQEAHARTLIPLLRDQRFTLAVLPGIMVLGRPAVGVKASYPERPDVLLYFDKETCLIVKTAAATGPGRVYDDYRETGWDAERLLTGAGLGTDGPTLIALLPRAPNPALLEKARALVKQLGDDSFEVREKAGSDLLALGAPAAAALETAVEDQDAEVSRRARLCLERIRIRTDPATVRAAVCLLGLRAPDGAAAALLDFLPQADEKTADEVRAALVARAQRAGGPDPAILRALDDKNAMRRETARAVLGKDGGAYLNRPGRRLLLPGVRVPYEWTMDHGDRWGWRFTVTDYQFFNRFDDKEFAKP